MHKLALLHWFTSCVMTTYCACLQALLSLLSAIELLCLLPCACTLYQIWDYKAKPQDLARVAVDIMLGEEEVGSTHFNST
jgi:hypothetical protein